MKFKFDRSFYWFSLFALFSITAAVFAFGWFHWTQGTFDVEETGTFYESSYKLTSLTKRDSLQKIDYYVASDRVKEAINEEEYLQNSVQSISRVLKSEANLKLDESLGGVKEALRKLLANQQTYNIFRILKQRVERFQIFVVENNWRTLTRLSGRLMMVIDDSKLRRPGYYRTQTIGPMIRAISRTVNMMESVTKSSVLTVEQKQQILDRLEKMKVEMGMLTTYLANLESFTTQYKKVQDDFKAWKQEIAPLFSGIELQKIRNVKTLYLQGIGVGVGVLFLFLLSFIVYQFSQRRNKEMIEAFVIDQIQDGLIPLNGNLYKDASKNFQLEFQKLREYVHKRMSLGRLFQEAIPLSSLLLDSNLNVIWGNDLFYESWNLEEVKKRNEQVTWNYLLQYTNLGEQDPIIDALKNSIAGIYHIQLKLLADRAVPYEMYVSPIEYLGETRIMIMFYPLQSFEETIKQQSAAIVGPVNKTIEAMMKAEFNQRFIDEIKKDFEIANIGNVLENFKDFSEFNNSIKKELASEIKNYKKLYEDKVDQVEESSQLLLEKQETLQNMMDELKMMKHSFVHYIETKSKYEGIYGELVELQSSLGKEYESIIMQSEELNSVLTDTHNAFTNVTNLRSSFQGIVDSINQFRTDILQVIDQNLLEIKGHEITPVRQHELLLEIKNQVKKVDQIVYLYGKLTTKLDVAFSKVQMIAEGQTHLDLSHMTDSISAFFREIDNNKAESKEFESIVKERELEVVQNLKTFYMLFKDILATHKELKLILKEEERSKVELSSSTHLQNGEFLQ